MDEYAVDLLVVQCRQQMRRYYQDRQESDPRFCHELLRRAFDEQDPDAGNAAFDLLMPFLHKWVQRHERYTLGKDYINDIAHETLTRLLERSRKGTFNVSSNTLPQVFTYIHHCAMHVFLEAQRKQKHETPLSDDTLVESHHHPETMVVHRSQMEQYINDICALLPSAVATPIQAQYHDPAVFDTISFPQLQADVLPYLLNHHFSEQDCRLIELRYIENKRPKEIAPQIGIPVSDLYRRLASILRRLRKDPILAKQFGFDLED